jgi:heme/copper-type cytochrome/quinol oxidase subunit 4
MSARRSNTSWAKYDASIAAITIIGFIISIVFTIVFFYFTYLRAKRRVTKARRDALLTAKALCAVDINDQFISDLLLGETTVGAEIQSVCREILATSI